MVRTCVSDRCSTERDIVRYPKSWVHERAGKQDEHAGCTDVVSDGSSNDLFFSFIRTGAPNRERRHTRKREKKEYLVIDRGMLSGCTTTSNLLHDLMITLPYIKVDVGKKFTILFSDVCASSYARVDWK